MRRGERIGRFLKVWEGENNSARGVGGKKVSKKIGLTDDKVRNRRAWRRL